VAPFFLEGEPRASGLENGDEITDQAEEAKHAAELAAKERAEDRRKKMEAKKKAREEERRKAEEEERRQATTFVGPKQRKHRGDSWGRLAASHAGGISFKVLGVRWTSAYFAALLVSSGSSVLNGLVQRYS
jgi:uncharacterized membrane protein YdbT with pleckstrin-like domain